MCVCVCVCMCVCVCVYQRRLSAVRVIRIHIFILICYMFNLEYENFSIERYFFLNTVQISKPVQICTDNA